jgi:hypothetical protein
MANKFEETNKSFQNLRPGEREFWEHFEKHHSFEVLKKEETTKEKAHETIKEFVKKLHQDIENLPEVQQEAKIHHQPLEDVTNILSTALEITLSAGILEGLNFIRKIGNPHLLDTFHDLLAGHFFDLLVKSNKLKIIQ